MWKLVFRILILVVAFSLYFIDREMLNFATILQRGLNEIFLWFVWITLVIGMLYRIFPNKRIAIGARKHFSCSYKPTHSNKIDIIKDKSMMRGLLNKGAFFSVSAWFLVSVLIIFALFLLGILTPAAVLILSLIYSILDLVFILFFCPFKMLFIRNHCCTVCRIYNWDYFMMCTPLIIFPNFYSISLFLLSMTVLAVWEISLYKNPHFFMSETNANLCCDLCEDNLCMKGTSLCFLKQKS